MSFFYLYFFRVVFGGCVDVRWDGDVGFFFFGCGLDSDFVNYGHFGQFTCLYVFDRWARNLLAFVIEADLYLFVKEFWTE